MAGKGDKWRRGVSIHQYVNAPYWRKRICASCGGNLLLQESHIRERIFQCERCKRRECWT